MKDVPILLVLSPSFRISGGNTELIRLAKDVAADGGLKVVLVSMWKHSHEIETGDLPIVHLLSAFPERKQAVQQLPAIAREFRRLVEKLGEGGKQEIHLLLGHYSTYPLAWLTPKLTRICFNQDMEWLFVEAGWKRSLLKRFILATNRRSLTVTANSFVTERYRALDIPLVGEAAIWADAGWLGASCSAPRIIDVLVLLRSSPIKRFDLYQLVIEKLKQVHGIRIAAITPDSSIAAIVQGQPDEVHLRPTNADMQTIYARSRMFLLLSDVEGFGLPPLEAMGSGCVPMCRDSGGVRCYMKGEFADLLLPKSLSVEAIAEQIVERLKTQRLPTPEAAQAAFREGLEKAKADRYRCIQALRTKLKLIRSLSPSPE